MVCEVVNSPDMPKKVEQRKRAISVTLTAANIDALEAIAARMEFQPSTSQLIDRAVAEYIARQQPKKSERK